MHSSEGYILAVGVTDRYEHLGPLPLSLCFVDTGFAALQQIRTKPPSVLVGLWDLPDMPGGALFRRLLSGAVSVTSIAIVPFGDTTSEIAARSVGVTVVLDDSVNAESLAELLRQLSPVRAATGT
jgi:DNA-binding NarL/FixJ family response regulator